jgi:hypothetical protein
LLFAIEAGDLLDSVKKDISNCDRMYVENIP